MGMQVRLRVTLLLEPSLPAGELSLPALIEVSPGLDPGEAGEGLMRRCPLPA